MARNSICKDFPAWDAAPSSCLSGYADTSPSPSLSPCGFLDETVILFKPLTLMQLRAVGPVSIFSANCLFHPMFSVH